MRRGAARNRLLCLGGDVMTENTSPFVPGARVAVDNGYQTREAFVDKVYKNGNFTLRGDGARQQWRPWSNNQRAFRTGDNHWDRDVVTLWTDATDAALSARIAECLRQTRLRKLQQQFDRLRVGDVTDGMLDAIEAALAKGQS